MKKRYFFDGKVKGRLWMGGSAYYPAERVEGKSVKDVLKRVKERVDDGSLEAGFGFNGLEGAFGNIYCQELVRPGLWSMPYLVETIFIGITEDEFNRIMDEGYY